MSESYLAKPKPQPKLNIPKSSNTVKVSCIDSTARITLPAKVILQPHIEGHVNITCPAWSFLIENETTGKRILFDLGVPKDWQNKLAPKVAERIQDMGWGCEVDKHISETLTENGWDLNDIDAIVWSHQHWDHVGDPSLFPPSTDLVVGPGFKKNYLPGFPIDKNSPLRESWWQSRNFVEHDIAAEGEGLKIGRFEALDYFADGSFYLLHTPGHTVGHLCGLARTSSAGDDSDTFVFMGGDACHHGGEFRPTDYLPLPRELHQGQLHHRSVPCPCPGELFLQQAHASKKATEPFYKPADGFNHDTELAIWTIEGVKEFDAHDNVLVAIAHDATFLGQVELFPRSMNGWKARNEREKVLWRFLEDFDVKPDQLTHRLQSDSQESRRKELGIDPGSQL